METDSGSGGGHFDRLFGFVAGSERASEPASKQASQSETESKFERHERSDRYD